MSESRCELERGGYMYPEALNDLENPPARLYVRGDPAVLKAPSLSIVGARSATPYGLAISEMAARLAVEAGLVVVSGGALGCDGAAGRAAISAGGRHVVVLRDRGRRRYLQGLARSHRGCYSNGRCRHIARALGVASAKVCIPQAQSRDRGPLLGYACRRGGNALGYVQHRRDRGANRQGGLIGSGIDCVSRVPRVELPDLDRGDVHPRARGSRGGDFQDLRYLEEEFGRDAFREVGRLRSRASSHGRVDRKPHARRRGLSLFRALVGRGDEGPRDLGARGLVAPMYDGRFALTKSALHDAARLGQNRGLNV